MEKFKFNYIEVLRWAYPTLKELEIRPLSRLLFLYLIHRANLTGWKILSLSPTTVANETGISRSGVMKFRRELIEKRLLCQKSGFNINYSLFPHNHKVKDKEGTPAHTSSNTERLRDYNYFGYE